MAFPWDFEENFETGTAGAFTGTPVDTIGKIDFPGPQDDLDIPPVIGGYVMRVDLKRGTDDAYVLGDATLNLATGTTMYARFWLYLSDDFKIPGATDSVRIFQLLSGGTTEEVAIALVRSFKGDIMLAIRSPEYNGFISGIEIGRNQWTCLELRIVAGGTASELHVYANGSQISAVAMSWVSPLNAWRMGAITQSADIYGTLYFDSVVIDNDRLVAPDLLDPDELSGETITLTKTGYAFVGPGEVTCVTLIGMDNTHAVNLYDTDRLPVAIHDLKVGLKVAAAESNESKGTKAFKRGCYVVFSGTASATLAPTVIIQLGQVSSRDWDSMDDEDEMAA